MKFKSNIGVQAGIEDNNDLTGDSGQILSSTGSGVAWINQGDITIGEAETAKSLQVTVKNVSGGELTKGTVVHTAPTASPPSGNVIEVIAADYDDTTKMPAIGILKETIANEAEGEAVMTGALSGIATDAFSIGDELYVGADGALTNVKPQTAGQLIQKIAVCVKSHASNGLIKIFGAGRSNDVPLPLYIDNANQRLGIGTASPTEALMVEGWIRVANNTGIKFNTSASSGDPTLNIDSSAHWNFLNTAGNNLLKIDNGGNVGIGTTDPKTALDVNGSIRVLGRTVPSAGNGLEIFYYSPADSFYLEAYDYTNSLYKNIRYAGLSHQFINGNVGIGTTSPTSKIHVIGQDATFYSNQGDQSMQIGRNANERLELYVNDSIAKITAIQDSDNDGPHDFILNRIFAGTGSNDFIVQKDGSAQLTINTDGNVGIGTDSPGAKLHTKVGTSGGAPYDNSVGIFAEGATRSIIQMSSTSDAYLMFGDASVNNQAWLGYNHATDQLLLHTGGTINMDGNVGIGTINPRDRLDLYDADDNVGIYFHTATSGTGGADGVRVGLNNTHAFFWNYENTPISFGTNGSQKATILANGNVGIGTTSPDNKLHVYGGRIVLDNTLASQSAIQFNHAGTEMGVIYRPADYSNQLRFFMTGAGDTMTLNSSGNVGIGTTSPEVGLHVKGSAVDNKSLLYIENEYLGGGVFFPAAKFTNLRSNHSYGIVSEFRTENAEGTDRPAILFSHNHNDWSWTIGQGVYSANDNFSIGSRSVHPGETGASWATPRLTIVPSNGNVGINETSPGAKLEVGGNIAASDQVSVNNRTAISVAHWAGAPSSTGAIKISLPGTHTGNWSMIVLRITTYEYNSNNHTVYYVSGHDWTSGWYNNGVTKIGDSDKDISLAYDSNKDYVIVGETTSSWSYGHVTVDVMAHPSFYSSSMDIRSGWGISQDADLTGITIQAVNNRKVLTSADAYYTESESDSRFVNVSGDTMTGDLTLNNSGQGWVKGYDAYHSIKFRAGGANKTEYYEYGGTLANGLGHKFFTGGTTNQTLKFQVADDGSYFSGDVGIGTTSISTKFDVVSNGAIAKFKSTNTGTSGYAEVHHENDAGVRLIVGSIGSGYTDATWAGARYMYATAGDLMIKTLGSGTNLRFYTAGADNERMRIDGSGNVGIGTTSPDNYKLQVVGTVESSAFSVEENISRIFAPSGATYNGNGTQTGYLAIGLPDLGTSGINNMMTGVIRVFDYTNDESFDVHFAGYWYAGYNWTNCTAWIESASQDDRNFTVRFGRMDGAAGSNTRPYITIGESNSSWTYCKFSVVNYQAGHSNFQAHKWDSGWNMDINATIPGPVLVTKSNTQANNWTRNGQDVYYSSGTGNVGIGTTSPSRKLHVVGGSTYAALLDSDQDYTLGLARSGTEEWWLKTYTDGRFAIHENGVGDKVTIKAGGNVGIGTTDPGAKLEIKTSSVGQEALRVYNSGDINTFELGHVSSNSGYFSIKDNDAVTRVLLRTDGGDSYVDHAGSFGIGTDNPSAKLDVIGTVRSSYDGTKFAQLESNSSGGVIKGSGGNGFLVRSYGDSYFNGGDLGIGVTSPSYKLDVAGNARFTSEINMEEDHYINLRFEIPDNANSEQYILLCRYAGGNDVNGTITMDRTSGLRHACSVDIIVSAGSSATPVGGLRAIGTSGAGNPKYNLVSCYLDGVRYVALEIQNPDSYYESTGAYFTGRIKSTGVKLVPKLASELTTISDFEANTLHTFSGDAFFRDGNVGIGTDSPGYKLDVNGSFRGGGIKADPAPMIFTYNEQPVLYGYIGFGAVPAAALAGVGDSGINSEFPASEAIRIASGGNVGIGTTSPGQKLDVAGNIECNSLYLNNGSSTYFVPTYYGTRIKANCAGLLVQNGSTYQAVYASAFSVQSDYRLKSNVVPLDNAIDRLKQMSVHRFNWNDRLDEPKVDGFIAHELSEVIPEAVLGEKDATKEDGTPDYQGIDQSKIVPLLTAALQDAITKIEQLETRIQTLENYD